MCFLQLVFCVPAPTLLSSPSFSPIPAAPTTPPLNVTVSFNESSSSLEIRWVKPPLGRIHGELQGYRLWYRWQSSKGLVSHRGNGEKWLKPKKNPAGITQGCPVWSWGFCIFFLSLSAFLCFHLGF